MSSDPQGGTAPGLLEFTTPQQIFQIGNTRVGGHPGAQPTVLIGTVFYHRHDVVRDAERGEIDADEATRRTLLTELKELAPDAELSETLNVLPKSDVQARLAAEGFRRSQERAERKLTTLVADLATARSRLQDDAVRDALAEAGAAGQSALAEVRRPRADGDIDRVDDGLKAAFDRLGRAAETLARMAGAETAPPQRAPEDATEAADALALGSERIDDVAAARSAEAVRLAEERLAELDRRYRARLDELERRLGQQTPRQRLAELARSHAVFFSNDSEYRDPRATGALLDQIARLMRETDASLRVVGYTDDVGSSARNSPISQARAERVVADLAARGVPGNRMIAVGRPSGAPIAPGSGAESPNRRAEFELAFSGERGGRP